MTDVLKKKLSRRSLLRIGGCAGVAVTGCGVSAAILGTQTDLFDRILGVSDTPLLENADAWTYEDHTLTLALDLIPELADPGTAVRLEDGSVPEPLLIVHGADSGYYAYINKCPHAKRRIDPLDGKLECTSFSKSTFDYAGTVLSGPADSPLTTYTVARDGDQLVITLV
jgi:nitrite reductase/ring-hydroxylating ferredoxin subunit